MKLYLIRHADAVSAGPGLPDSSRYLSADGRQVARRVGRILREEGVSFDLVLTSPLVRAVQTAELMAEAVDYLGEIRAHGGLVPGCEPQVIAADAARRGGDLALFGHEPSISALAAYLTGQPSFQPFRKGQVILIEDRRPVWRIKPTGQGIEPQF